jgi:FkbM family methyltransferase
MIVTATAYDRKVKVEIHDDELTSNIIKEHKAYSNADLFLMKQSKIGKDDIFIDMGANIGWNTIYGAQEFAKVYSFEPYYKNVKLLKNNLIHNHLNNVTICDKAISNRSSTVELYLNGTNYGDNAIEPNVKRDYGESVTIETITFDEYIEQEKIDASKISCIKMDIQGQEIKALEGMVKFLDGNYPNFIIEYAPAHIEWAKNSIFELFAFVDNYDYVPFRIHDKSVAEIDIISFDTVLVQLSYKTWMDDTMVLKEYGAHYDLFLIHKSRLS